MSGIGYMEKVDTWWINNANQLKQKSTQCILQKGIEQKY